MSQSWRDAIRCVDERPYEICTGDLSGVILGERLDTMDVRIPMLEARIQQLEARIQQLEPAYERVLGG